MLKGKVAVISGATRGIGKAIALELANQGCHISFSFAKSLAEAAQLEQEIIKLGVKAKAFQVDIKDFKAVQEWIDKTRELFGTIDLIVNNAGIIRDKALAMMLPEDWMEVINTNLVGTVNLSKAAMITLIKQKSGTIVNITSVTGVVGMPRQTNYAASKAGIIGFTKALAKEVAPYNIRVNAVAPGFIETDMISGLKPEQIEKIKTKVPLGRMGKVEEVAAAVRFLLCEESRYITGQTLIMDGGLSLG